MKKKANKASHKAKSSSDWARRFRLFAAGQKFGRGEKPPTRSRWHTAIQRIESCPAHNTAGGVCICEYHRPAVSFYIIVLVCFIVLLHDFQDHPRVPQPVVSQPAMLQPVMSRTGASQAGVSLAGVQQTGVLQTRVPQAGVHRAEVPQTGVLQTRVPQAGVHRAEVPQTGVLQTRVPQAGVHT